MKKQAKKSLEDNKKGATRNYKIINNIYVVHIICKNCKYTFK